MEQRIWLDLSKSHFGVCRSELSYLITQSADALHAPFENAGLCIRMWVLVFEGMYLSTNSWIIQTEFKRVLIKVAFRKKIT